MIDTHAKSTAIQPHNLSLIHILLCSAALAAASAEATQVSAFSTGHFQLSIGLAATMMSCFTRGAVVGKVALGFVDDRLGHALTFLLGVAGIIGSQALLLISDGVIVLIMVTVALAGGALSVYSVLPPLMTGAIFGQKEYNKYWAYIMSVSYTHLGPAIHCGAFEWLAMKVLTAKALEGKGFRCV